MCWRKDVKWDIHTSDDPKQFMTVTSGEYILAVPDYNHEARYVSESPSDDNDGAASTSQPSGQKNAALFKKVIMKLSGDVKWMAGLVFEGDSQGDQRTFSFKPHYDVVLQNPRFIKETQLPVKPPPSSPSSLKTIPLTGFLGLRCFSGIPKSSHPHVNLCHCSRDWELGFRQCPAVGELQHRPPNTALFHSLLQMVVPFLGFHVAARSTGTSLPRRNKDCQKVCAPSRDGQIQAPSRSIVCCSHLQAQGP